MSTWIVPLLNTDFQDDLDKLVINYIETNYNILDPLKTDTDHFRFASGLSDDNEPFDLNQPYECVVVEKGTRRELELGPRENNMSTLLEVNIRMERLDHEAAQFGYMKREVIRVIGQYAPNDIVGIRDIVWEGGDPIYSNSSQDWRYVIYARIYYELRNVSP
jgi:hypothetical protein